LASSLGTVQPFRYRGYVFDQETGWFYCQSRYFDPEVGRFISADALLSTGQGILGYNMYAYCLNNPVARSSEGGVASAPSSRSSASQSAGSKGGRKAKAKADTGEAATTKGPSGSPWSSGSLSQNSQAKQKEGGGENEVSGQEKSEPLTGPPFLLTPGYINSDGFLYFGEKGGIYESYESGLGWWVRTTYVITPDPNNPGSFIVDATVIYYTMDFEFIEFEMPYGGSYSSYIAIPDLNYENWTFSIIDSCYLKVYVQPPGTFIAFS